MRGDARSPGTARPRVGSASLRSHARAPAHAHATAQEALQGGHPRHLESVDPRAAAQLVRARFSGHVRLTSFHFVRRCVAVLCKWLLSNWRKRVVHSHAFSVKAHACLRASRIFERTAC
eukprot:761828-Pleurochrysis_carterae.AAC.1